MTHPPMTGRLGDYVTPRGIIDAERVQRRRTAAFLRGASPRVLRPRGVVLGVA